MDDGGTADKATESEAGHLTQGLAARRSDHSVCLDAVAGDGGAQCCGASSERRANMSRVAWTAGRPGSHCAVRQQGSRWRQHAALTAVR
mmetsp:Transcript_40087/g.93083  ORF Transcript_40087/g.93083 Transcript_40087/m.93083 type:complete len:89 (-) Transcript_40087:1-267(-)